MRPRGMVSLFRVRTGGGSAAARGAAALAVALSLLGCSRPALKPDVHYVLGKPYQVAGVWFYPRESFDLDETGLAAVAAGDAERLTTDGEAFDQDALAASHATIQLPAIARLTNLENGRQVMVRLNDRGPGDPRRLVEVTRRTAVLLGMTQGRVARVRLQVLASPSHAATDGLAGAPSLALQAAPRGAVQVADLAPPLRLPETVTQTAPQPGQLMVALDTFEEYQYAAVQRAKMSGVGAHIMSVQDGRTHRFRVVVGPLSDVAHADAVLEQALASGIPDARIVVE